MALADVKSMQKDCSTYHKSFKPDGDRDLPDISGALLLCPCKAGGYCSKVRDALVQHGRSELAAVKAAFHAFFSGRAQIASLRYADDRRCQALEIVVAYPRQMCL